MGSIIIKGSNLEMIKLDTIEGNVSIKGRRDGAEEKSTEPSIHDIAKKKAIFGDKIEIE